MDEKKINARLTQLHNTAWDWEAYYLEFIPKAGELVVYDPDENFPSPRFKIGDGRTKLSALPFYNSGSGGGDQDLAGAITWEGDTGFIDSGEISSYIIPKEDN